VSWRELLADRIPRIEGAVLDANQPLEQARQDRHCLAHARGRQRAVKGAPFGTEARRVALSDPALLWNPERPLSGWRPAEHGKPVAVGGTVFHRQVGERFPSLNNSPEQQPFRFLAIGTYSIGAAGFRCQPDVNGLEV